MFDYKHYIPILRWKAAEREGLGLLSDEQKKILTPVIELLMPQPTRPKEGEAPKSPEQLLADSIAKFKTMLPDVPNDILKFWGKNPAFLELNLIDASLRTDALKQILNIGKELDISLIPVISLNADTEFQTTVISLVKKYNSGLCLRLFRSDFNEGTLETNIKNFLEKSSLSKNDIDLLVDLQIVDDQCLKLASLVNQIPAIGDWRTFTVASGAFPKDLTEFTVDLHKIKRSDWNDWLNQIESDGLLRKPSFGDYTIQHPIYKEPLPGSNPSASIRYTLEKEWMIMRGQGLRGENSKGHAQYPANAQLLVQQPEFFGTDFSSGDSYIAEKGKDVNTKETGTPRTWLRAGINHHLACVVSNLSNLS